MRQALWVGIWWLSACAPQAVDGLAEGELSSERVIAEGTPEAVGVLAFVNAPATTMAVLDDTVGLDKRAAKNIIAHRDGADARPGTADDDPFGTVDELDAVSYVGDAALSDLLDYARDNGWIKASDPVYGRIEGVDFTVPEATATVALANEASEAELDVDAGLDKRAADGLVARRPFPTLEAVAASPYVGTAALNRMRVYSVAHGYGEGIGTSAATAALTAAADGLLFTSESDYPLEVFTVAGAPAITTANAKTVLASVYVARADEIGLAARPMEQVTIAQTLDRYTVPEDWWEDNNRDDAPRWQALRAIFDDDLEGATVFRFGEHVSSYGVISGAIDVFIVGYTADGDLVGVRTISIET
jgi:DNA uptake protein ComE-like DNA-binding protein